MPSQKCMSLETYEATPIHIQKGVRLQQCIHHIVVLLSGRIPAHTKEIHTGQQLCQEPGQLFAD